MANITKQEAAGPALLTRLNHPSNRSDFPICHRTRHVEQLRKALSERANIALFGPPQCGKSTLLLGTLGERDRIYIECSPDFKRPHIYRLILSALGYAISVGKKKKSGFSIKASFAMLGAKVAPAADASVETSFQDITVDLSEASEVAHLVTRVRLPPLVVLNNFQELGAETKKWLLKDILFFSETSDLRFLIAGTWEDEFYLESFWALPQDLFRKIVLTNWDEPEMREYLRHCEKHLPSMPALADRGDLVQASQGSVGALQRLLRVLCDNKQHPAVADLAARTSEENFRRLKSHFSERIAEWVSDDRCACCHESLKLEPETRRLSVPSSFSCNEGQVLDLDIVEEVSGRPQRSGYVLVLENWKISPEDETFSLAAELVRFALTRRADGRFSWPQQSFAEFLAQGRLKPNGGVESVSFTHNIRRVIDVQRKLHISPALLSIDSEGGICVPDSNFRDYMLRIDEHELLEMLEEVEQDLSINAKKMRKRRLSVSFDEEILANVADRHVELGQRGILTPPVAEAVAKIVSHGMPLRGPSGKRLVKVASKVKIGASDDDE